MWLNHLFIDSPIDFEKRCRNRVWIGVLFLVLGAAALALSFVARDRVMAVSYTHLTLPTNREV